VLKNGAGVGEVQVGIRDFSTDVWLVLPPFAPVHFLPAGHSRAQGGLATRPQAI